MAEINHAIVTIVSFYLLLDGKQENTLLVERDPRDGNGALLSVWRD